MPAAVFRLGVEGETGLDAGDVARIDGVEISVQDLEDIEPVVHGSPPRRARIATRLRAPWPDS